MFYGWCLTGLCLYICIQDCKYLYMVMDYMPGNTENLDKTDTVKSKNFIVLYFDQRMNAWVCMVVNN